jgi:hypothetical protein
LSIAVGLQVLCLICLLVLACSCWFFYVIVAPRFPCSGFGSFRLIYMLDSDGFCLCVARVEAGFIAVQ